MNNDQEKSMTYQINFQNAQNGVNAMEVFKKECETPMEIQKDFLMQLLNDNKDTEYGKKYDFANIHSIEDFQKKIPVITYDDIAEPLERMMRGEKNILTSYPFGHMNETSGTIGFPKVIPMTDKQSEIYLKYNNANMYGILKTALGDDDDWMRGRGFSTTSGTHRTLESGITVGEAASKMADYVAGGKDGLDNMVRTMYTSPVEGLIPEPGTDTKYIHARFALEDEEVRGIVSAFYSVIVLYLQYIADNYEMLIDDIEKGTISDSVNMPDNVRASLLKKIKPMPERAKQLKEIFKDGSDFPFVKKIWPHFTYVCGVGSDGFSIYDELLKNNYIGETVTNIYSGVTASEGLWSIPFEANNPSSALVAGSAFMEFLPVEAGDDFSKCVTMDKLELGKTYELIVTTVNGFYRYRMSDAVKITGKYVNTPTVEFMYRVNRTINLAEEKTTEKALQVTCENVAKELGFTLADFSVYPDTNSIPNKYIFLIEPKREIKLDMKQLQDCVFKHLIEANPVYNDCYVDKWLDMPEAYFLQPETSLLYRDMMVMKGASLNQLKPVRIITNELQRKFFFLLRDNGR